MTRIDFYIQQAPQQRELTACRLAEKAWQQGHRVYLNAEDPAQATRLDELLWSFRAGSFLPHEPLSELEEADNTVPIHVGSGLDPSGHHGILINLASEVPLWFSRFERVVEPIDGEERVKTAGRERFRFYRDRGYDLQTHNLG